jgi:hypothetical protein
MKLQIKRWQRLEAMIPLESFYQARNEKPRIHHPSEGGERSGPRTARAL